MPATGREILTSRSYQADAQRTIASRRFRTEAVSKAEALQYAETQGLTAGGLVVRVAHPDESGIVLDSLSLEPQVDGTYDIVANYSNSNLFVLELVSKKNNGANKYARYQVSTYDYKIKMPYAVKEARNVSAPGVTPATTVQAWVPYEQEILKTDVVLTIEVRPGKLTVSDATLIAGEANRLHKFSTQADYWLFVSGTVQPINDTEDIVTYTWRRDRGDNGWVSAINPTVPNASLNLYDNQGGTIIFPDANRPPHFDWKMKMAATGPTGTPLFWKMCPYTRNDNGYTTMPGLNGIGL